MSDKSSILFRYVLPPYACFLLIGHMLLMMILPDYPLGDPGTPWHFKWGQIIVEQMHLPRQDFFSHTMPGQDWINYQWFFHVMVGVTQKLGGIAFTTAVLMSVYALIPVLLMQRMLKEGCHAIAALFLAAMAWFILTMHSLDRPHVFTYVFFSILLERLYRIYEGKTDLKQSWWLIPMMTLWTNIHGGFSVGLFLIGVVFLVAIGRCIYAGTPENFRAARHLLLTGLCCGLASLINPYGIYLHLHVLSFLDLKVLAHWQEFGSADFYNPSGNIRGFELLMMALLAVFFTRGIAKGKARIGMLDLVLCLTFLHFALQSARHIILFTLIAIPVVARGLDDLFQRKKNWFIVRRGYEINRQQRGMLGGYIYYPLIVGAYLLLSLFPTPFFQNHFYDIHLSRQSAEFIREHPDEFKRPFNTDNVGGALIYYFSPEFKVFADDRADFYWQDFMQDEYFKVRFGQKGWDEILDKYQVDSLILPNEHALQALLLLTPIWEKVHEDELNVIYFRRQEAPPVDDPALSDES